MTVKQTRMGFILEKEGYLQRVIWLVARLVVSGVSESGSYRGVQKKE